MRCSRCPATKFCKDFFEHPERLEFDNGCCFGEPGRPYQEVCKECDVIELCRACAGAAEEIVVMEET